MHLDRIRSSSLGALLIVALGVTGIVTYKAYHAAREHRAIVERVLNDYVTFASYQLGNSTKQAFYSCATSWFGPALAKPARATMQDVRDVDCGQDAARRFEIDFASGQSKVSDPSIEPALLSWLQDTIPKHRLVPFDARHSFGIMTRTTGHGTSLIVFVAELDNAKPTRVVGFTTQSTVRWMVDATLASSHMLPPALAGGAADSTFFNVVVDPERAESRSPYATVASLGPEFGDISLSIALKPGAISRIVPGGLPDARGFEFILLLALAVGLVLSSLLLLQRESQLARERAGFVSSVSHELRTPLAQIRMFAEMLILGRARNDAERRRSLEIIDKETRRLSHLVENVLQVARADRGTGYLNPTEALIAPVVRETVEAFTVLEHSRNIDFRLELEEKLIAPIDTAAVRQMLLNLLDNAAKYGPPGQRVVVGLALFGNAARLWVDDEGPGVPMRERERVFEPFYRSRRDLMSTTTGSGIGLAVVRELATLHGGSAWIEDAPGAGARLFIEFPDARVATQNASDSAVA